MAEIRESTESKELVKESQSEEMSSGPSSEVQEQRSSELEQESNDSFEDYESESQSEDTFEGDDVDSSESTGEIEREQPLVAETESNADDINENNTLNDNSEQSEPLEIGDDAQDGPSEGLDDAPIEDNSENEEPLNIDEAPEEKTEALDDPSKSEDATDEEKEPPEQELKTDDEDVAEDSGEDEIKDTEKDAYDPYEADEQIDQSDRVDDEEPKPVEDKEDKADKEKVKDEPIEAAEEKETNKNELSPEKIEELKQKSRDRMAKLKENPSGYNDFERGELGHTTDKAKFNGKNFKRLEESMGKTAYEEAYAKALKENKSEIEARADADRAKQKAELTIAEKRDSYAKYCDEDRFLNHANAEGEKERAKAKNEGKNEEQCQQAYYDGFRQTYISDYGKRAYENKLKETGDERAAEIAKIKAENLAKERTGGSKIKGKTADSEYYQTYDELRKKDDVKVGHGEAFNNERHYVHSADGKASGNYSTTETHASPRDSVRKSATTAPNTAKVREEVEYSDKTNTGKDVYGIEGLSAPKIAEQEMGKYATKENEKIDKKIKSGDLSDDKNTDKYEVSVFYGGKEKLIGGDKQVVTSGNGYFDGSVRKIERKDSPENIETKQKYIDDLSARCQHKNNLKDANVDTTWDSVRGEKLDEARSSFNRDKKALIKDWEAVNGEKWPTYKEDIYNAEGRVVRKEGDKFDAHHIQPLCMGGRNVPENLVPLHYESHIGKGGIHNTESYDKLFDIYDTKKD